MRHRDITGGDMAFWQIVVLLFLGAIVGFVLSAKLASRYYIGVGMAVILHAYMKVSEELEMMDQLNIIADGVSAELHTEGKFKVILEAARKTVKDAMFK
jgi:hypothetical protein